MDLNEIMTGTETVTFDFLGEPNTAEVYTAGISRLTQPQLALLRTGNDPAASQKLIPMIVKSWDLKFKGELLELEHLNDEDADGKLIYELPVAFMDELAKAADAVMRRGPTDADLSPNGSAQKGNVTTSTVIQ